MISTGRSGLCLRPFERRHLTRTRSWTNDSELGRLLGRARGVSEAEHESWFSGLADRADTLFFAVETLDGRHIGNVWLADISTRHRRAEIRIVIGEADAVGHGFGPEAIELLASYAFSALGLHRVYAYVLAFNPRAKRAFEKAGFALEGVLRDDRLSDDRYTDVFVLGRLAP